jgi:hypothetical protein
MEPGLGAQDYLEARRRQRTASPLGRDNESSQAVLTANADESEPELAWADPDVGETDSYCKAVFSTKRETLA